LADVTVRLATEEDVSQILPLIRSLVASCGEPLPDEDAMAEIVRQQVTSDNHEYVVAESKGSIFGCLLACYYLSTWAAAPYAMLQDFYIEDTWRNQGVGSTMFAYARDRARIRGCARMDLAIQAQRVEAKRFFSRWGFRRTDREMMRMALTPARNSRH
jgi:N-acetylglutamate synthase-like GNAT family acetyltransferase